jgi:hypothetical protein
MKMKKHVAVSILATLLSLPVAAQACQSPQTFFISILLGKVDSPAVVRLVHSRQLACSRAAAEENFGREIAKEFSGYKILDTLTMSADPGAERPRSVGRVVSTNI